MSLTGIGTLACLGGESLSERSSGRDTYLEPGFNPDGGVSTGAIGVDPELETTYVLQARTVSAASGAVQARRRLVAVDPASGATRNVLDLDGTSDARVLFPKNGVLVMAERGGRDELTLLDPRTLATRGRASAGVRYHGTRMSASRAFVAVADNSSADVPIHVIEGATLRTTVIPHDGTWLEAMWQNTQDRLVAMVAYGGARPSMRFMVFDMERVRRANYATEGPFWRDPVVSATAPDTTQALGLSWSWVGVSNDDRFAVFPVEAVDLNAPNGSRPRLYIMNLTTGALRWVDDAAGPVGISPDGSTIVAYRSREKPSGATAYDLVLIDERTLERRDVALPFDEVPVYHTTRTGHRVVLTALSSGTIHVYDLQMRRLSALDGDSVSLAREFAVRPRADEIWVADNGLHGISLREGRAERIPLDWRPAHLNILPRQDALVLDVPGENALRFFDAETRTVVRHVSLPAL